MTQQQWLEVAVGDVVIDMKCGQAERTVLRVSRISGRRGQKGKTRTMVEVKSLKSRDALVLLMSTEDLNGGRFILHSKAPAP